MLWERNPPHRWLVDSPNKERIKRKVYPCHIIMYIHQDTHFVFLYPSSPLGRNEVSPRFTYVINNTEISSCRLGLFLRKTDLIHSMENDNSFKDSWSRISLYFLLHFIALFQRSASYNWRVICSYFDITITPRVINQTSWNISIICAVSCITPTNVTL